MTQFGELVKIADNDRRLLNLYDSYLAGPRSRHKEAEVLAHILTKNEESNATGERDRTGSWSASGANRCLRERQFTYLGMPQRVPDSKSQNIFSNGDFVHLRYQMVGLIQGWLVDVETPVFAEGKVRGTVDGISDQDEIVEIKSINANGFSNVSTFGPKDDHKYQTTAYMMASGRSRTRFIYENKNTNENLEFVFELEQQYVERVQEEFEKLNENQDSKVLEPMLHECINKRSPFKWCDYRDICEGASYPTAKLRLV